MPRALLVTYEFPPMGGVGVQRVTKLAKYLPAAGWNVSVLTVEDPPSAMRDERLLDELPESVKIHRAWSLEPTRVLQAVRRMREGTLTQAASVRGYSGLPPWVIRSVQAAFIPDEKRLWRGRARRAGLDAVSHDGIEAIVSSGPPYTAHLIALDLARRTGHPWVADFRDPWVGNYFFKPPTPFHESRQRHWERRVVLAASAVAVVSEPMAQDLRGRYPELPENHFVLIPNGFDPADMPLFAAPASSGPMTIAYLGSFQGAVSPFVFFEGLRQAIDSGEIPRGAVRVRVIGPVSDEVTATAEACGLAKSVEQTGFLPHKDALARTATADVLLLVLPPGPAGRPIVTGKLPEYLGLGRTVLALAPDGAAADIVRRASAGPIVDPSDPAAVAAAITRLYRARAQGGPLPVPAPDIVAEFDRRRQAELFARLLDRVSDAERRP